MRIVSKTTLTNDANPRVIKLTIKAPRIAHNALPGQFVVVMATDKGERTPLTIVDTDQHAGTITIIAQEIGYSTTLLGKLNVNDTLFALTGPLGHPTEIKNYGSVILVGGGVGVAEIFPIAKAFKTAGNTVTAIIGAQTNEMLILKKELAAIADTLYSTTDDGSTGEKGLTTDILKKLIPSQPNLVYAVGPIPMMKAVSEITKPDAIKTLVSLNALMVDATGMCGSCRVTVNGEVKFTCVDGPDFDAHAIDWDEATNRSRIYHKQEKHICTLHCDDH